MATKGRKVAKRKPEETITLYPIKYAGFSRISEISFTEDRGILEQHGVPIPPTLLRLELNSNNIGIYQLVKHVLMKYEEHLLDAATREGNGKFEKRKAMLIKLISAVTLRWYSIYRWKTYDRIIEKSINAEVYGAGKRVYGRTQEDLHIYQILWQEHCNTMKSLLKEWNDVQNVLGQHGISGIEETSTDMADVMSQLNGLVHKATSEPEIQSTCHSKDKATLKELLKDISHDIAEGEKLDDNHLDEIKKNHFSAIQAMVFNGIRNFEETLESLSSHFNLLSQMSRLLSSKMFKKIGTIEYLNRIEECHYDTTKIKDIERQDP